MAFANIVRKFKTFTGMLTNGEILRYTYRQMKRIKPVSYSVDYIGRKTLGTITHVITDEPVVALTFDGGPDPRWTPRILEVLARYNVPGTFFMIGKYAEQNPEIVNMVAERNHVIANHSWNHPGFPQISRKERRRQIRLCSDALAPHEMKIFRAPYLDQSIGSRIDLFLMGYKVIAGNVKFHDERLEDPSILYRNLIESITPGSIVLLHDVSCMHRDSSREVTIAALDELLKNTINKYQYLTLPELFEKGKPYKVNMYKTRDRPVVT